MEEPQVTFDWAIYADATFAGLSVLIPIPLVDLLFESVFRRRAIQTIASRHGREVDPAVRQIINRGRGCSMASCLLLPPWLIFQLLKRLSKKIVYFLTVKDATDALSYYWHRAFLLDYMLRANHLDDVASATAARQALDKALQEVGTSPLTELAREVIGQTRHVFRSLWRVVRRGREDDVIRQDRNTMRNAWANFGDYLEGVAGRYQERYRELIAMQAVGGPETVAGPGGEEAAPPAR